LGTDDWAKRLGAAFGQRELAECRTLLMDPAKAPVYSKWQQAGMLAWEGLTGQVQRCLASFLHAQETQPRQLIGLGGGFQMHGVVAYLRRPAG
jgi:hypothetical protein